MLIYYPALIASAIVFATIVINYRDKNYGTILLTSLLAIPAVLFLVFLSQKNLDIIAYIIILIPIILIYVGYNSGIKMPSLISSSSSSSNHHGRIEGEEGASHCISCNKTPCKCPVKINA